MYRFRLFVHFWDITAEVFFFFVVTSRMMEAVGEDWDRAMKEMSHCYVFTHVKMFCLSCRADVSTVADPVLSVL